MRISKVSFFSPVEELFEGKCSTLAGDHGIFRFRLVTSDSSPLPKGVTSLEVLMGSPATHNFGDQHLYKSGADFSQIPFDAQPRLQPGAGFPSHDSSSRSSYDEGCSDRVLELF